MSLDRRTFLSTTLGGAAGAVLGRSALAQAEPPSTDPFQRAPLGETGVLVSRIGVGTGMKGYNRESNQTRLGGEAFESLLRYAWDRGVRLFDCADIYGTHPFVARALADKPREEYALVSKIWFHGGGVPEQERPDADVVVERFLKELNTDYIDIVQIHCQMSANWHDEHARQREILEGLKERGLIRTHGVSVHSLDALRAAADSDWVDVVHARINAFGDAMDGPPEEVAPVIASIHEAGKGVIGMKLVGEGRYRDDPAKRDASIAYVLGLGSVDTMIVGFESAAEIDDFANRVETALRARAAGV